jgi:hypothetical protein
MANDTEVSSGLLVIRNRINFVWKASVSSLVEVAMAWIARQVLSDHVNKLRRQGVDTGFLNVWRCFL